jgi:hypothetical protein
MRDLAGRNAPAPRAASVSASGAGWRERRLLDGFEKVDACVVEKEEDEKNEHGEEPSHVRHEEHR